MSETRNIVVLGAGFAGLSASHYFMKHLYPSLKRSSKEAAYKLIIIDQSTHFWWHIAAPRAIASTKLMQHNKTFMPIEDAFKQYGQDQAIVSIRQAQPVSVDTASRIVTVQDTSEGASGSTEKIQYYSLLIATGTTTPTPVTSFHGSHKKTQDALDDMNSRLAKATSVIIAGGGPVGVETAGEVGEALNGPNSSVKDRKVKVTVVTGGKKLLPVLGEKYGKKATKLLNKVGVDVVYNTKVTNVDSGANDADKTTVTIDNGSGIQTMTCDVYIPAIGVTPNTSFFPKELLNERGYVQTNPATLRVDGAGERVYALGDVGSYTRGGVIDLPAAVTVFGNNFGKDIGLREADKQYKADNTSETQFVPVGSKGGVGAFKGFGVPSFVVKQAKGKNYLLSNMPQSYLGSGLKKP